MRPVDLDQLVPGFRQARQRERINRSLALADVPWTLCGLPCVHLTPRHRLELQLAGNAFTINAQPLLGDIFQLLWRLNPCFSRPPLSFRAWRAHRKVRQTVRHLPLHAGDRDVREYITAMLQDMPETGDLEQGENLNPPEAYVHWMSAEARFFMVHLGMRLEEYKDTPYLVLQQLNRAHRLANDPSPQFINASDRLVKDWFKANQVSR